MTSNQRPSLAAALLAFALVTSACGASASAANTDSVQPPSFEVVPFDAKVDSSDYPDSNEFVDSPVAVEVLAEVELASDELR